MAAGPAQQRAAAGATLDGACLHLTSFQDEDEDSWPRRPRAFAALSAPPLAMKEEGEQAAAAGGVEGAAEEAARSMAAACGEGAASGEGAPRPDSPLPPSALQGSATPESIAAWFARRAAPMRSLKIATWDEGPAPKLAALVGPALRGLHAAGPARLHCLEVSLEGCLALDAEGPQMLPVCTQLQRLTLSTGSPAVVTALPAGLTALDLAFLLPPELFKTEPGLQLLLDSTKELGRRVVMCAGPAQRGMHGVHRSSSHGLLPERCAARAVLITFRHVPLRSAVMSSAHSYLVARRLTRLEELRYRTNAKVPGALPVPWAPQSLRRLCVKQPFLADVTPYIHRLTRWAGACSPFCPRPVLHPAGIKFQLANGVWFVSNARH